MKKLLFLACVALLLISCGSDGGNNDDKNNKNKEKTNTPPKGTDGSAPQKGTNGSTPQKGTSGSKPQKGSDVTTPQKGDKDTNPSATDTTIIVAKNAEEFETKFVGKSITISNGSEKITTLLIASNKNLTKNSATAISYVYTYINYKSARISTSSDKCVYTLVFKNELAGKAVIVCDEGKKELSRFQFNSKN